MKCSTIFFESLEMKCIKKIKKIDIKYQKGKLIKNAIVNGVVKI